MQVYKKAQYWLSSYTSECAESIVKWVCSEEVFYWWSAGRLGSYPVTKEKLDAQFSNDGAIHLIFNDGTTPVGHIMLRYLSEDKSEIRFGYIVVDSSIRGKGYGKQMLALALEYAFKELSAERVTLGVFEDNIPAQHCYESVGFEFSKENEYFTINGQQRLYLYMECRE